MTPTQTPHSGPERDLSKETNDAPVTETQAEGFVTGERMGRVYEEYSGRMESLGEGAKAVLQQSARQYILESFERAGDASFAEFAKQMESEIRSIFDQYASAAEGQKEAVESTVESAEQGIEAAESNEVQEPVDWQDMEKEITSPEQYKQQFEVYQGNSTHLSQQTSALSQEIADLNKEHTELKESFARIPSIGAAEVGLVVGVVGTPLAGLAAGAAMYAFKEAFPTVDPATLALQKKLDALKEKSSEKQAELTQKKKSLDAQGTVLQSADTVVMAGVGESFAQARAGAEANRQELNEKEAQALQQWREMQDAKNAMAEQKQNLSDQKERIAEAEKNVDEAEENSTKKEDELERFDGTIEDILANLPNVNLSDIPQEKKKQIEKHREELISQRNTIRTGKTQLAAGSGQFADARKQLAAATGQMDTGLQQIDLNTETIDSSLGSVEGIMQSLSEAQGLLQQQYENINFQEQSVGESFAALDEQVDTAVINTSIQSTMSMAQLETSLQSLPEEIDGPDGILSTAVRGVGLVISKPLHGISKGIEWMTTKTSEALESIGVPSEVTWLARQPTEILSGLCEATGDLVHGVSLLAAHPVEMGTGMLALFGRGPDGSWTLATAGETWKTMGKVLIAHEQWSKGQYGKAVGRIAVDVLMTVATSGGGSAFSAATRAAGITAKTVQVAANASKAAKFMGAMQNVGYKISAGACSVVAQPGTFAKAGLRATADDIGSLLRAPKYMLKGGGNTARRIVEFGKSFKDPSVAVSSLARRSALHADDLADFAKRFGSEFDMSHLLLKADDATDLTPAALAAVDDVDELAKLMGMADDLTPGQYTRLVRMQNSLRGIKNLTEARRLAGHVAEVSQISTKFRDAPKLRSASDMQKFAERFVGENFDSAGSILQHTDEGILFIDDLGTVKFVDNIDDYAKNVRMKHSRPEAAHAYATRTSLERKFGSAANLTDEQCLAVYKAHNTGSPLAGQLDDLGRPIYDPKVLVEKRRIMMEAGIDKQYANFIIEQRIAGKKIAPMRKLPEPNPDAVKFEKGEKVWYSGRGDLMPRGLSEVLIDSDGIVYVTNPRSGELIELTDSLKKGLAPVQDLQAEAITALKETDGWKAHLNFDATNPQAVQRVEGVFNRLKEEGKIHPNSKIGMSGGQSGKEATAYIGHGDDAKEVARILDEELADVLLPPGDAVLADDMCMTGKVYARFDVAGDPAFHQYGRNGIPHRMRDVESSISRAKTPDDLVQFEARSDKMLRDRYGEFYSSAFDDGADASKAVPAKPSPPDGAPPPPKQPTSPSQSKVQSPQVSRSSDSATDMPKGVSDVEDLLQPAQFGDGAEPLARSVDNVDDASQAAKLDVDSPQITRSADESVGAQRSAADFAEHSTASVADDIKVLKRRKAALEKKLKKGAPNEAVEAQWRSGIESIDTELSNMAERLPPKSAKFDFENMPRIRITEGDSVIDGYIVGRIDDGTYMVAEHLPGGRIRITEKVLERAKYGDDLAKRADGAMDLSKLDDVAVDGQAGWKRIAKPGERTKVVRRGPDGTMQVRDIGADQINANPYVRSAEDVLAGKPVRRTNRDVHYRVMADERAQLQGLLDDLRLYGEGDDVAEAMAKVQQEIAALDELPTTVKTGMGSIDTSALPRVPNKNGEIMYAIGRNEKGQYQFLRVGDDGVGKIQTFTGKKAPTFDDAAHAAMDSALNPDSFRVVDEFEEAQSYSFRGTPKERAVIYADGSKGKVPVTHPKRTSNGEWYQLTAESDNGMVTLAKRTEEGALEIKHVPAESVRRHKRGPTWSERMDNVRDTVTGRKAAGNNIVGFAGIGQFGVECACATGRALSNPVRDVLRAGRHLRRPGNGFWRGLGRTTGEVFDTRALAWIHENPVVESFRVTFSREGAQFMHDNWGIKWLREKRAGRLERRFNRRKARFERRIDRMYEHLKQYSSNSPEWEKYNREILKVKQEYKLRFVEKEGAMARMARKTKPLREATSSTVDSGIRSTTEAARNTRRAVGERWQQRQFRKGKEALRNMEQELIAREGRYGKDSPRVAEYADEVARQRAQIADDFPEMNALDEIDEIARQREVASKGVTDAEKWNAEDVVLSKRQQQLQREFAENHPLHPKAKEFHDQRVRSLESEIRSQKRLTSNAERNARVEALEQELAQMQKAHDERVAAATAAEEARVAQAAAEATPPPLPNPRQARVDARYTTEAIDTWESGAVAAQRAAGETAEAAGATGPTLLQRGRETAGGLLQEGWRRTREWLDTRAQRAAERAAEAERTGVPVATMRTRTVDAAQWLWRQRPSFRANRNRLRSLCEGVNTPDEIVAAMAREDSFADDVVNMLHDQQGIPKKNIAVKGKEIRYKTPPPREEVKVWTSREYVDAARKHYHLPA